MEETSRWKGLSAVEARARLKVHGPNRLPSAKPKSLLGIAREVMSEPMFLLLIACGVIYLLLGDYQEGLILSIAVCVIIGITFYQYRRTERALDSLKKLSSPRALVIRDGKETRIPGVDVVPGDLLILNEGDRIAADATLLETAHLEVDESILTGESVPVMKKMDNADDPEGKSKSLSRGSLVVRGMAVAEVLRTGVETEIGKIGKSLQEIDRGKTRLQAETKRLIRNLAIGGVLISILVVVLFYVNRGDLLQALLNGLASAMAILPEEFPVVMTVFIALGAWRLSRKKVLTRKPASIETLGSTTVLCTDKTGTLTRNVMAVVSVFQDGRYVGRDELIQQGQVVGRTLDAAVHATERGTVDQTDIAILNAAGKGKEEAIQIIRTYPLSASVLAMTIVSREHQSGRMYASCKGAPEHVFALCRLHGQELGKLQNVTKEMASEGLRVIGVAEAIAVDEPLPPEQAGFNFRFTGLIGLEDPIRPEVPDAIHQCEKAGIRVMMITGDYPVTAMSIARQAGLPATPEPLTGNQLALLNDAELEERVARIHVIARVIPDQKLRIVRALEANREVVAMTGDGVNDAPALKAADIGIAMGKKGTDVAREAASLVLLDDHFASIVTGIRLGRRIYDNLQKAMTYILSVHVPIVGLALLPAFFSEIPVLMFPVHIVFLELIIDPVCSVAFEAEEDEKGIMDRPPRSKDDPFFSGRRIWYSLFQGFLLLGIVLAVYFYMLGHDFRDGEVRAIAFASLIIGNVFLIMSNLSATRSFLHVLTSRNIAVKLILGGALIVLTLINLVPPLQEVFSFEYPGIHAMGVSLAGGVILLIILEGIKWFRNHSQNS